MRHVLRTIPSYFPLVSGPANQARAISRGLTGLGYTSQILTTNLGAASAPRRERLDGVEVVRAPIRAGFMQYHVAQGVWGELRRRPADLIHAHAYRNFLTDSAALAATRRGLPLVLHLHGTLAGFRAIAPRQRWWLYRGYDLLSAPLGALRPDHVIVSTSEERREAEDYGLDPSRISVIPMGIEPADYSFADEPRDTARIVFVGRLTADRNPALLLRALGRLTDLPWSVELVGAEVRRSFATPVGHADDLRRLAGELGIASRVRFTGQLHGEQLRRAYARAGIFVYPSRYENFGQTILEAAAAGCALLTTPVGVAHDLVRPGETGYVLGADDCAHLAARLRELLEAPGRQRALGLAAHHLARRGFSWGPILQRYSDIYADVLAKRNAP